MLHRENRDTNRHSMLQNLSKDEVKEEKKIDGAKEETTTSANMNEKHEEAGQRVTQS